MLVSGLEAARVLEMEGLVAELESFISLDVSKDTCVEYCGLLLGTPLEECLVRYFCVCLGIFARGWLGMRGLKESLGYLWGCRLGL